MSDWRSVAGLVLLALAAFGSWYLARMNEADIEITSTPLERKRGYYLEDTRIFGTGEDGALLYEITAARAEQRPDQTIEFENVNIRYTTDSEVPWRVDADTATIDPGEPLIRLRGRVVAYSVDGFDGSNTEIRTEYLELDPDNYVAETDVRVQIRVGARSLSATGVLASLKDSQLQLKSNVSGKFAP